MRVDIAAHVNLFPYDDGGQVVYVLDVPVPTGKPLVEVVLTVKDCKAKGFQACFPLYQRDGMIPAISEVSG